MSFNGEPVSSAGFCAVTQRSSSLWRPQLITQRSGGLKQPLPRVWSGEVEVQHSAPHPWQRQPFPYRFRFYPGSIPDFQILFLPFPSLRFT